MKKQEILTSHATRKYIRERTCNFKTQLEYGFASIFNKIQEAKEKNWTSIAYDGEEYEQVGRFFHSLGYNVEIDKYLDYEARID